MAMRYQAISTDAKFCAVFEASTDYSRDQPIRQWWLHWHDLYGVIDHYVTGYEWCQPTKLPGCLFQWSSYTKSILGAVLVRRLANLSVLVKSVSKQRASGFELLASTFELVPWCRWALQLSSIALFSVDTCIQTKYDHQSWLHKLRSFLDSVRVDYSQWMAQLIVNIAAALLSRLRCASNLEWNRAVFFLVLEGLFVFITISL